jgi:hypothetical protein
MRISPESGRNSTEIENGEGEQEPQASKSDDSQSKRKVY